MPNRPAVLRKEFIFDEYQILEARLAGADTILLIVKMLEHSTLLRLYHYSRSLGMEPLVEVNTAEEMKIAVDLGAEVIGVNNRNLTSFEVDLNTTSRLMTQVPESTIVCALSGISGPRDVAAYHHDGVKAVLIGEALMRAPDTTAFVAELLGGSQDGLQAGDNQIAVKICGTRTLEAARAAIDAGADLIGMILVPGRKRHVPDEIAIQISRFVRSTVKPTAQPIAELGNKHEGAVDFFDHALRKLRHPDRALIVGVFVDAPLQYIIDKVHQLELDIVQLHGSEPLEWARLIPVPVIRRFAPGDMGIATRGYHIAPLLDTGAGGSGQQLDYAAVRKSCQADPGLRFMLAGGLKPSNVASILNAMGPDRNRVIAVDISSGVESDGKQDHQKIAAFLGAVKGNF
jgi:anthranilate synthase / indole-3-glycerol phosphate synthase / phosphoribosylanthranilate isomerase